MVQSTVVGNPEFLNLQPSDISPLIASCDIKVFYLGQNRNGSFIDKETGTEMGRTLRGNPIVGWYKEEKEDFRDHGEVVTIDDEGVHFSTKTVPYGFVSPDAKVWFQDFEEVDDFGNPITRTYLMTQGYLWVEQFPEAQKVVDDGKGQSMELDKKTLTGNWSLDINSNREFFIINSALISKLCILGDDVEPCFEGSSITAPDISKNFTLEHDKEVLTTMLTMFQTWCSYSLAKDVQDTLLKTLEGGIKVETEKKEVGTEFSAETQDTSVENPTTNFEEKTEEPVAETETSFEAAEQSASTESQSVESEAAQSAEFAKKDDEKEDSKEDSGESSDEGSSDDKEENKEEDDDKEDTKKKFTALQQEYDTLKAQYDELQTQFTELKEFKDKVELQEKKDLIDKFTQLTEEDKKDVVEHISEYSLSEIKSKLAVICFDKDCFSAEQPEEEKEPTMTVNINTYAVDRPEWLDAVDSRMSN